MGDLAKTDLSLYRRRYGRGVHKRKHTEETSMPSGDVTAVNNFPRTTSSSVVSASPTDWLPANEETVVNNPSPTTSSRGVESTVWVHDNRLLAGYLAHEFLTKGTLLGEQYDPARTEAVPIQSAARQEGSRGKVLEAEPGKRLTRQSYAEVASVFLSEGTHIPGIVNPTELARWIHL